MFLPLLSSIVPKVHRLPLNETSLEQAIAHFLVPVIGKEKLDSNYPQLRSLLDTFPAFCKAYLFTCPTRRAAREKVKWGDAVLP